MRRYAISPSSRRSKTLTPARYKPILAGQTDTHRQDTVAALDNFRCIRTATHKYIQNYNDCDELYDLEQDPDELDNIAAAAPDMVGDLARRLHRRLG